MLGMSALCLPEIEEGHGRSRTLADRIPFLTGSFLLAHPCLRTFVLCGRPNI